MRKGLFITGTDTNVGKTVVSSILCAGAGAAYWKPVQTGTKDGSDTDFIRRWTSSVFPEVYRLEPPLSPHAAARHEEIEISLSRILKAIPKGEQDLIIEGAGGVMVPLNDRFLMIDLIQALGFPAVVVARSALGTINHTVLTIEALRARTIPIAGVVMVGETNSENRLAIEYYGQIKVLAEISPCPAFTDSWVKTEFKKFDQTILSEWTTGDLTDASNAS